MMWDAVFQPFIEQSPVSVMFRGTLENILSPERMNHRFAKHARQQYGHRRPFSCCVEMLGLVVVQTRPSVNAAYQAKREQVAVSVQSVYQKLAGIEPQVSEALVRETAADLAAVVDAMHATTPGPLSGYDCRIVDGNHLQGTHHRLKELRRLGDAALPGSTVAVLDPQPELIEDIVADEIAGVSRGMAIVIGASYWTAAFAGLTPTQLARKLLWLAKHLPPEKFLCNPVRVKKRKARRIIQHGGHVSTHRLLQKRKSTKPRQQ